MGKVCVIGLGYVGLPLLRALCEKHVDAFGLDTNERHVAKLLNEYRLDIYSSYAALENKDIDTFILCLPTPVTKTQEPDLSYIYTTMEQIDRFCLGGPDVRPLIVLESTTYPGTTRELAAKYPNYDWAYSPERIDPGSSHDFQKTPKLLAGLTQTALHRALDLYGTVFEEIRACSSPEVAEAAKLTENIYRAVNIALVNELKVIYTKMGIDIWEVLSAAGTKPYGFERFNPGPGWGGHCIPVDPFYLAAKAKEVGYPSKFIERAGEINREMPAWVVNRLRDALDDEGIPLSKAKVLLLGWAYKPDVADTRESPARHIWEILQGHGATVHVMDPLVSREQIPQVVWTDSIDRDYDAAVLVTDHDAFCYSDLDQADFKILVDTRNRFDQSMLKPRLIRA